MKALLLSLVLSINAYGQSLQTPTLPATTPISFPLEVQRLAPQLVAFAGGDANFQNLVNGLASGSAVTLTTALPTGGTQVVSFTPTGTMTVQQIAQTLENVRQSLIVRGIAAPNAQQLATALTGGALLTPSGPTQVGAAITTTTAVVQQQQQSTAVQIQNTFSNAAAGASTAIRSQTSDSPFPRGISDTPANTMAPQTPAPIATPPSSASIRTTK
ncbi:MAG TPA: hypothetical protein VL199_03265 [Burkholderiales bacterium]|jgi:hypothetical protein|nr:hypothetical protein [Burkholderiales bacterium]